MAKDVRIGDVERDEAVSLLQEHHIAGRLSVEELDERITSALTADTGSDIANLFLDLPDLKHPRDRRRVKRGWILIPVVALTLGAGALALQGRPSSDAMPTSPSTAPAPTPSASASTQGMNPSPSSPDDVAVPSELQVVDYGFGQSGDVTQGIVIVRSDSEAAVGEFLTVSANFLDAAGELVGTETQVESFSWVGQELALPVWFFSEGQNAVVARLDPSISLSDYGVSVPARSPLPVLESTDVSDDGFGGYKASFDFTNETGADLSFLRVGVACYNTQGKIIGGTSTYPELAPAGKTIRIDAEQLVLSETPTSCKAFVNYP